MRRVVAAAVLVVVAGVLVVTLLHPRVEPNPFDCDGFYSRGWCVD